MYKAPFLRLMIAPLIKAATRPLEVAGLSQEALKEAVRRPAVRPVIEIDRCVTSRLNRFGETGSSPLQRASEIYLRTRDREAVRAHLASEIEKFRPRSLAQVFFGRHDEALAPLSGLHGLHTFLPWDPNAKEGRGYLGQRDRDYGPPDPARVEWETDRVVHITQALGTAGYRPESHWNGYLRGYFLVHDGDYRFFLKGGRHRAGAMAALGIPEASVRLSSHIPPCIDCADADKWPQVRSGRISRELALRMFHRFFA